MCEGIACSYSTSWVEDKHILEQIDSYTWSTCMYGPLRGQGLTIGVRIFELVGQWLSFALG